MRKSEVRAACVAVTIVGLGGCQAHERSTSSAGTAVAPRPNALQMARATAPLPEAMRLPDTVRPIGYDVALTVVPTEARFDGHMIIAAELRAPANVVWLNATGLDVRAVTINGAAATVVPGGSDVIGIQSAAPLPAGPATLVIDYSGEISSKNERGVFKEKEGGRWYTFTGLAPIEARRAFPCFDEPSFKVPWKVRLKVKRDDMALSNAPAISETIEGDFKIVQFAETKPLPSYLVNFAVGPFDAVDAGSAGGPGKKGTPVRIIVPRGRGAEARFAKEVTVQLVNRAEGYFGIPYPYEKLDVIDVPIFGGAFEAPGLVTFAQSLILSAPEKETVGFHRAYIDVAMHEIAHQWFGNLVTAQWWDDIWQSESLAVWTANRLIENWKPEWHEDSERAARTVSGMAMDSLVTARRIRQPIENKDDMANLFGAITYFKGSAVIDMFENWLGREAFRNGPFPS